MAATTDNARSSWFGMVMYYWRIMTAEEKREARRMMESEPE